MDIRSYLKPRVDPMSPGDGEAHTASNTGLTKTPSTAPGPPEPPSKLTPLPGVAKPLVAASLARAGGASPVSAVDPIAGLAVHEKRDLAADSSGALTWIGVGCIGWG